MNSPAQRLRVNDCPYQTLHIYYIDGPVDPTGAIDTHGFIGNWEEAGFTFLFFSEPSDDRVDIVLEHHPDARLLDRYRMTYEDWQGGPVEPFSLGGWFIAPPWNSSPTPAGLDRLILDPGVVFGTGTHPTTRDCLDFIDRVMNRDSVETALDVGTGTGLLALAAARSGVERVLAFDFNRLAAETARRNILLNGLENRVLAFQGRAEEMIGIGSDLCIANIHYDVMKHLLTRDRLCRHRWFILSGLLRSEARDTADLLARLPVEVVDTRVRDGIWHTFLGTSRR